MADLASRADRPHDRQCRGAQLSDRRGAEIEADARGRQDGVERTAIADVTDDPAEAGNLDFGVSSAAANAGTLSNATLAPLSVTCTATGPQGHSRMKSAVPSCSGTRPDATAQRPRAIVAWPHIVLKPEWCMNSTPNAAGGAAGTGRAPYISAWPRGSNMRRRRWRSSRDGVVALLQDGGTAGFRKALKDEAHWLAAGVHLDGAVGGDRVGGELGHGAAVRRGHSVGGFVDNAPGLDTRGAVPRGGVPERLKGTDCKSVGARLRWFESNPLHSDHSLSDRRQCGSGASARPLAAIL